MSELPTPHECANCGATIPRGAKACQECGADERTGWREQSIYDGLDLPEPEPDANPTRAGLPLGWKITGVGLIVLAMVLAFRNW